MPVVLHKDADGRILILTLSGKLESENYAHFTAEVERAVIFQMPCHVRSQLCLRRVANLAWTALRFKKRRSNVHC